MGDQEERNIKDRIILVTGASKGIGAQVCKQLAKKGAVLILLAKNEKDLQSFTQNLKNESKNEKIHSFSCDIASIQSIDKTFEEIKKQFKHIDVLINNAGIMPGFGMDMNSVGDDLDVATIKVNVEGTYFVTKRAIPLLLNSPPADSSSPFDRTIINVSSCAGWLEEPEPGSMGMLSYRMSKTAQNGLTVALHKTYVEEKKSIQRVISVHPGFVQTGLGRETWEDKSHNDEQIAKAKISFGAISVEEGADTIVWAVLAKSGLVESGKNYYQRKVHSW